MVQQATTHSGSNNVINKDKNMKKIFLMSLLAGAIALTSCDPAQESVDNNTVNRSQEEILKGITFTQYSDEACTTPAEDGNYIKYATNPGMQVQIFAYRADGSMNLMASGASGKFSIKPSRGSDPNQSFFIRHLNSDGTVTTAETSLHVYVQQELDPEIRLIASDAYGSKTWVWDTSITGAVWGNMGYCGGAGADVGLTGNGQWWGITTSDEFNGQLKHTEDGTNHGDGDLNAKMVIADDGTIKCYDANGNVIRTGTYAIKDWNPSDPSAWRMGMLETSAGAILWPYEINSGGKMPTQFEICYLTPDKMTLVYPDGGAFDGLGGWGEATFWHFKSSSDVLGMAMGYEKSGKSWTWDTSITGAVWGNMGYCGGAGADVGTTGNGQWWGVTTSEEFNGQLQHTEDGTNHGDGDLDAYMTFTPDGLVNSYTSNGSQIRGGTFEFKIIEGNEWKIAELNTTPGSILWPYEINSGGNMPSTFEVVYLTNDKMTLVYPDGGDFSTNGSWGEASYWHFKAK